MILDSSAVIASLANEPEAPAIRQAIIAAATRLMSAVNVFETRTVLNGRFAPGKLKEFELLLLHAPVLVLPFDADQAELAFAAYRRFSKGSGHPAQLNFGDCAAYALATSLDLPLLFKGDDFGRTDVRSALAA